MATVATGSIADRPFGRTVAAVAHRRFTGTLRLGASSMGWKDGLVVSATGTHPADGAVKTALGAGLVTSSQAAEIMAHLKPGLDDVAIVGERGKLGPDQVTRLRRRVVANRAMRLFSVVAGQFVLDDLLADAPEIVPIDANILIYHGVRAHYDEERTLAELASLGDSFRLKVPVEHAVDSFAFGELEQASLAMLALRPYTPTALVDAAPNAEARVTLSALYALAVSGQVEVVAGARARNTSAPSVRFQTPSNAPPSPLPVAPPVRSRNSSVQDLRVRAASAAAPVSQVAQNAVMIRALVAERLAMLDRNASLFELLAVTAESSPDALRAAYFNLARQLHPDRITATGLDDIRADAQRLFAQINAAFGILSNPKRRGEYLKLLAAGGADVVRKQQEQAEATAKRLLDAEHEFRTGEMALRRNQLDVAVAAFRRAVELDPEEGEHHALLAWATWVAVPELDKVRAAKEARVGLEKGATLSPKSPVPYVYLGKIARSIGDDRAATAHFRRALEVAPGHEEAASELRVLESRQPGGGDEKKGLFGRFKR